MPHYSYLILEMGKWGISIIFRIEKRRISKKDTWLVLTRKREMNRKWNCSNLGYLKKCIWPHVKNTSFTCFLGHFMIPRVLDFWILNREKLGARPSWKNSSLVSLLSFFNFLMRELRSKLDNFSRSKKFIRGDKKCWRRANRSSTK